MKNEIVLFGGLLLDRYFQIDRWPERGQDGFWESEESFVGDCSINMAATIHNLGGQAHIATCLGTDKTGQEILRYLEKHGLSRRLVYTIPGTTGSCLVFSEPEGERTFLTHTGMETQFPPALAREVLALAPAWAGVTGYYLLGDKPGDLLPAWKSCTGGAPNSCLTPARWSARSNRKYWRGWYKSAIS